jgi:hypothetical protein
MLRLVNFMLNNGASSKIKDKLGWRIMDEAIQQ